MKDNKTVEVSRHPFFRMSVVAAMLSTGVFAAPLTLTWNGGATGNFSDESWDGGEEGHQSPQNGDTLVFGTGGTFASDIAGLQVAALKFTSSSAVTISGSEKITVLCGGEVRSTGAGVVTNLAPMQAGESAGESVGFAAAGSGRKLVLIGNISGAAPIGVGAASGTVEFRGTNTFTGKLSVTNGFFSAIGKNSLGAGTEEAYFKTGNGSGTAKVTFTGVIVRTPIRNLPSNLANEITFAYDANSTKTVFWEPFTVVDASPQWTVNGWTTVVFSNKLTVAKDFQCQVNKGGKLELSGEGSSIRGFIVSLYGESLSYAYNGTLTVTKPLTLTTVTDWAYFGPSFRKNYGVMKMNVDDAFPNARADYGWNPLSFNADISGCVFDMNGHSQTFTCIRDSSKVSSHVIKNAGKLCVLRLKQDTTKVKPGTTQSGPVFYGTISGKVSVSIEGSDPCFFSGPNTSTGDFCLTNGATSGFTSTGVWKGTNYVVSGGSTLVVSNTAAFAANSSVALIDDAGNAAKSCLLVGDGDYSLKSMTVNGRLLYKGTWGSSASGAKYKNDVYFKGPGVVTLATGAPSPGMTIVFQ